MKMRTLGSTGIKVSEVGFGAWQLGNKFDFAPMDDAAAVGLVHKAMEGGINLFDTAPNYGKGSSETLLGKALAGKRKSVVITSKVGHGMTGGKDFDPGKMLASVEGSLTRLQTDYLDSLLLHNPPIECLNGSSPQFEVLRKLKAHGKIRSFGASVDWGKEVLEVVNTSDGEVLELLLNIFHQEPVATFEAIKQKNVGVIVKVPLDSGWLSGRYHKGSTFVGIRTRWSPEVIARRCAMLEKIEFVKEDGVTLPQAALRFVLAFDVISSVMPGTRDLEHLKVSLSAAEKEMPKGTVERLRAFWKAELEKDPLPW